LKNENKTAIKELSVLRRRGESKEDRQTVELYDIVAYYSDLAVQVPEQGMRSGGVV
jgi:hypothetical protein